MAYKKYKIKENFFSFTPRYTISDEEDRLVGTVNKHAFSFKKKVTIFNESEDEVSSIYKELFSFQRTYYIHKNGIRQFKIFKTFSLKPKIFVESLIHPDAFLIQGDIWSSEFAFYRDNKEFAYVSRKIWNVRDSYLAAIKEDEDQFLILAVVLVLDFFRKSRKNS